MHDNRPIGIFDSGIGGLSIFEEIKKLLPQESVIYFADQKNNPYGGKTSEEIKKITTKIVEFLIAENVKLIVVACNTATVHSLSYLRGKFDIPIVGVVPVVKTLALTTKTGNVAVFSTPSTAKSRYLKQLINKFARSCKVYVIGDSKLEHLVEKGEINGRQVEKDLAKVLLPLVDKQVDCIALGCTHYPFLRPEMEKVLKGKIKIFDSGEAVARQVRHVLLSNNSLSSLFSFYKFYTSGNIKTFKKTLQKLTKLRLADVRSAGI